MIGKALHILFAAGLVTATAVVVAEPHSGGTTQAENNKQICRTMMDTGSRLGRYRACHTAREWEELRRQAKQNVDRIQNNRPDGCPPFC